MSQSVINRQWHTIILGIRARSSAMIHAIHRPPNSIHHLVHFLCRSPRTAAQMDASATMANPFANYGRSVVRSPSFPQDQAFACPLAWPADAEHRWPTGNLIPTVVVGFNMPSEFIQVPIGQIHFAVAIMRSVPSHQQSAWVVISCGSGSRPRINVDGGKADSHGCGRQNGHISREAKLTAFLRLR